jgi:hypothetical protein
MNASSVVWTRSELERVLADRAHDLESYRLMGDWLLYAAAALRPGKVAYVAEPLNVHRRHGRGVTDSLDKRTHLEELRRIHGTIAEWLGAGRRTRARMSAYESRLGRDLGLSEAPSQQ